MLSLTDEEADAGRADSPPAPPDGHRGGPLRPELLRLTGAIAHEGIETLLHPDHLTRLAGTAVQDAGTLARLLTAHSDARTVLKAPLHGMRRVAWSTPFPLDRVKAAGRRTHGTVNDVLMAAVTGSLRSYLQERGDLPGEVHVMVPFNLRAADQPVPRDLGNDFALILLALPVGIEGAGERMRDVKIRMDAIKHSHEGPISFGILSAIGMTPAQVENRLIGYFSAKASAVVTNVPGPRRQVYLAGSPVRGVLVWAPCSGDIGTTVSIFSYAGEVTAGFMTAHRIDARPGAAGQGLRTRASRALPGDADAHRSPATESHNPSIEEADVTQRRTSTTTTRGDKALERVNDSIDAAQAALKDLRSEMSRGSRELLKEVETTLRDARQAPPQREQACVQGPGGGSAGGHR